MNILFCQPTLDRSGSEKSLFEIMAGLRSETDYGLYLVAGEDGPMSAEFRGLTDALWVIDAPKLRRARRAVFSYLRSWWKVYLSMRRIRRERPIDLIYVNTAMFPQALLAAALNGLPRVTHIHEVETTYPGTYYRFCVGVAALLSARIICACRYILSQRGLWLRHRLLDRAFIIPNASAFDVGPLRRTIDGDARVLSVIPITRRKGIDDVLSLAAEIKRRGLAARIRVVGRTGDSDLFTTVRERCRIEQLPISFHPETADMRPHYAQAHVLVHASYSECHPRVLVEAANFSLPVICTDAGGSAEAVADGETGCIVAIGDFRAMADRIEQLVNEPELYARFSANAYRRYENAFTRAILTARVREVIESVTVIA